MLSGTGDQELHVDPRIREFLSECPFLVQRVDLAEGVHYIMGQVTQLLTNGDLSDSEMDCVFSHLEKMAAADRETKNVLVVGVLEMLCDTPKSVELARNRLKGPARFLFERVLAGWAHPAKLKK